MFLKFFICDFVLTIFIILGINGQFEIKNTDRFSKVRYLISNGKDFSGNNKPLFQWDAKLPQEINTTPMVANSLFNYIFSTTTSPLKKPKKAKNIKVKKQKRTLRHQNTSHEANTTSLLGPSSILNVDTISKEPKKKNKRRRKKKKKNKRVKQKNNIPKMTTASNYNGILRNMSLDELISKLNENPEVNLNNLNQDIYFNKTITYQQNNTLIGKNLNGTKTINLKVDLGNKPRSRCRFNNGGCSHICRIKGLRKCVCFKGYNLDKDMHTCKDVDECKLNNGGCQTTCHNTVGSYQCRCAEGFRLDDDGKSCVDVNECLRRNGHGYCDDLCTNTYGSYVCSCGAGTVLAKDRHSCVDIDECVQGKSGCTHICINTIRGAFCACPEGMELSLDSKTCQGTAV
ncbi:unnamed protein product [Brassicogethes aeneus]|uniref:EGF-like domain-containing protein n=1 Tax=Brassicogethes aeneus TaxID=1431903 RepID=A0A9P0ATX0_BRAAE|nr:unnamed protein product [Brassicogethes aeneus]